jgi:large subunit ribosomal protein L29
MSKLQKTLESIRSKDHAALKKELAELKVSLQKSRVELAFGRLPNVSQINEMRKQIARIETVLKQKETTHA